MEIIQDLFGDDVLLKNKRPRTPQTKLKVSLNGLLKKDGFYAFKIIFNRVYCDKIQNFPKGITKEDWLNAAMLVHGDSDYSAHELLDKKKANQ